MSIKHGLLCYSSVLSGYFFSKIWHQSSKIGIFSYLDSKDMDKILFLLYYFSLSLYFIQLIICLLLVIIIMLPSPRQLLPLYTVYLSKMFFPTHSYFASKFELHKRLSYHFSNFRVLGFQWNLRDWLAPWTLFLSDCIRFRITVT